MNWFKNKKDAEAERRRGELVEQIFSEAFPGFGTAATEKEEDETERLRKKLLDEACAGAFSGFGAMLLDADEIRRANREELEEISRRYGHR